MPDTSDIHPEYRVELEAYAGPLDLLLYLVKRHEIDLHDIPVARLTEQYLRHLEIIRRLDMDQAGEFLLMAATLLEIKSRMLMPSAASNSEADGGDPTEAVAEAVDPRFELVQQLLAYQRYKDAAIALEQREAQWAQRYPAQSGKRPRSAETAESGSETEQVGDEDAHAPRIELDLEDVTILDLGEAFTRILDSIGSRGPRTHEVTYDETPISLHAADIYDRLLRDGGARRSLTLREIFEGRHNRSEMIGLFLATLELVRRHKVRVEQDDRRQPEAIRLKARPQDEHIHPDHPPEASATDWRDPETGEVQYDWPDDAARRRYERRQNIRADRAAQGHLADAPMLEAFDQEQTDACEAQAAEKDAANQGF